MRILIYSPKFYPSVGGLENLTLMLAKEFVKQGHVVKVICFEKHTTISCGVDTYYCPSVFKQALLYFNSDVLYMPNISLKGLWLRLLNPFKNWVISHNGWYGSNNSSQQKSLNERIKLFLLRFAKNISVSKSVAAYIPVPSVVIANCYDASIFHTNYEVERTNNIVFVGRLVSDKGIDVLVKAMLLLWERGLQTTLTIIGKGEMEVWIANMISEHNLSDKIILKGVLTGSALAKEINKHSYMAVPSTWHEPFGIVALEGLACGCRIICSSGGGLPEAAGPNAVFFENGNVKQLSEAIESLVSNTASSSQNNVVQFLQQHSIQQVAQQYLQVFQVRA